MVQNPLSNQNPAVTVGVGADTSGFTGAIDDAIAKMGSFKGAATVAGGALAALGAGAMVKATQQAKKLETAFAEVSTLMDENADAAEVYGDGVERLSTEFAAQGGQVEVINGLYQTLSAGITDATESTMLMEVAMKSATAGLSDTETAVDILTTVVNAYGLEASEASRISDVLFETVRQGKTRYDELASSTGQLVPISSELGVEFETVGAALATLTAQGQSTDQAVTAVRQAMVQLLRPQEDLLDLINELGFETGRALVESEGFAGALRLLNEQAEKSDVELGAAFGRVQAMQAVLPLAGGSAEEFAANIDKMNNSAGATNTAFEKMSDTAEFQFRQAMNEVEASLAETGDQFLPFAAKGADAIATLVSDFNDLNEASDGAVGAIGSVGLALGGLALVAGGPITLAIAGIGALAGAYATDFADIRTTVKRSMNDIASIMDRTLLAMTGQTESELGKQEAEWKEWAQTIESVVAEGVDLALTSLIDLLDKSATEAAAFGNALSGTMAIAQALASGDLARAGEIAQETSARSRRLRSEQRERSKARLNRFEERVRRHRAGIDAASLEGQTGASSVAGATTGARAHVAGQPFAGGGGVPGEARGQSPLQQAMAANRAQDSALPGGGTVAGTVPTATTASSAGGFEFEGTASESVASFWTGKEPGDTIRVDRGLVEDMLAADKTVSAATLGISQEEFQTVANFVRGRSGASAAPAAPSGVQAATGGVSPSVSTFDKAVSRFEDAVDKFAESKLMVGLKDDLLEAFVDGRIEVHDGRQADELGRLRDRSVSP